MPQAVINDSCESVPHESGGRRDCLHWIFDKFASEPLHSLDTLSILGLQAEFKEAVNAAATLGLETSEECIVNLSEWNIQVPWRSFGGL